MWLLPQVRSGTKHCLGRSAVAPLSPHRRGRPHVANCGSPHLFQYQYNAKSLASSSSSLAMLQEGTRHQFWPARPQKHVLQVATRAKQVEENMAPQPREEKGKEKGETIARPLLNASSRSSVGRSLTVLDNEPAGSSYRPRRAGAGCDSPPSLSLCLSISLPVFPLSLCPRRSSSPSLFLSLSHSHPPSLFLSHTPPFLPPLSLCTPSLFPLPLFPSFFPVSLRRTIK